MEHKKRNQFECQWNKKTERKRIDLGRTIEQMSSKYCVVGIERLKLAQITALSQAIYTQKNEYNIKSYFKMHNGILIKRMK